MPRQDIRWRAELTDEQGIPNVSLTLLRAERPFNNVNGTLTARPHAINSDNIDDNGGRRFPREGKKSLRLINYLCRQT